MGKRNEEIMQEIMNILTDKDRGQTLSEESSLEPLEAIFSSGDLEGGLQAILGQRMGIVFNEILNIDRDLDLAAETIKGGLKRFSVDGAPEGAERALKHVQEIAKIIDSLTEDLSDTRKELRSFSKSLVSGVTKVKKASAQVKAILSRIR